ncbi:MAG TPA: HD domain-containing phosphohydrolase [Tepidisphaeraceae bacterium]|jgi:putative nucleotidyltransferase with HDIG domain/PAS domain S-box-containing protein
MAIPPELLPLCDFIEKLCCAASIIDRHGRIIGVNNRLCSMMARPREQIVGQLVEDFYDDPLARASVHEGIRNFSSSRETEFYLQQSSGRQIPVISSARALVSEGELSEYRLVTMIDISKQKDAETQALERYHHVSELTDTVVEQALQLKHYSESLEEKVRLRTCELRQANLDAIYMLAIASEAKDLDTGKHVRRIQQYSQTLAIEMGLGQAEAEAIGYASILHDVGKMHVPDSILKKPGPLTPDERQLMESHTIVGARIISGGPFFDQARRIARHHHENFDGSGYPDHLAGQAIPREARLVHLVDVYDALINARAYKPAWTVEKTLAHIRSNTGTMFDPVVVDAFFSLCQNGKLPPEQA